VENNVEADSLFAVLVIGGIAGWLAGKILKGKGFGLIGNIAVGIVGAFVGGFLLGFLGLSAGGFFGSIITATIGAVVLLFLVSLIKKV
jgi:uncharacterized membrane protein YeaQ/YmgE (transglycosylase-associated protein family)